MKSVLPALLMAGMSLNAQALGRLADVQIVDRDTGATLTAYRYRGEYWVACRPGESYEIAGWRKSDQEIAAFEFTAAPQSYAERIGRPANVGVIGVALFRERPQPCVALRDYAVQPSDSDTPDAQRGASAKHRSCSRLSSNG